MSDSQAYEEVTVTAHGVTVTKRFEEDEFPVPAIAFEFSSERDETVRVRLEDTVPDSVEVEDLGFHPEYGSEYWTIDEKEITFERDLDANAEYTSVYGIRATGTDDVEKFLTRPEITDVDPPLPEEEQAAAAGDGGDDVIPESDDDVVRDVISGESDEVPGLDEESDEEIETLDLKDPNEEGSTETAESGGGGSSGGEAEASGDSGEAVSLSGDSLVTALATELRQNEVSAEDVKLLRQAFEIAGQEGGSIQARVERVQSDIADLRAYTDALEEFLDENGTAEGLIEDFSEDVEALEETVQGMESTITENSEELSAVSEEVGSLGDDVAELNEEVTEVSDEMADVSTEVSDVSEEVSEVSAEFGDVEDTVEELEESLEQVQSTVEELEGKVTEGDVAERIEGVEEELEDLQTWQDQIKETFGG